MLAVRLFKYFLSLSLVLASTEFALTRGYISSSSLQKVVQVIAHEALPQAEAQQQQAGGQQAQGGGGDPMAMIMGFVMMALMLVMMMKKDKKDAKQVQCTNSLNGPTVNILGGNGMPLTGFTQPIGGAPTVAGAATVPGAPVVVLTPAAQQATSRLMTLCQNPALLAQVNQAMISPAAVALTPTQIQNGATAAISGPAIILPQSTTQQAQGAQPQSVPQGHAYFTENP
ncbi:MAG: hypothetical protein AB7F86_09875 [Bdellovibrionales bacterium]